jgi:HSP20 family protein
MSSSRGSQWNDFLSLRDMMENLMPGGARMRGAGMMGLNIPVDLWEAEHEYILKAFIPGARSDDIHIQVHGDTLRISGEVKESPEEGKPVRWLIRERQTGHFQRTITLPQPVQANEAQAEFEHGVLTVRLPEAEEARTRTIPIGTGAMRQRTESQPQPVSSQAQPTSGQPQPAQQTQPTQQTQPAEEYSPTERGSGAPYTPASNSSPAAIERWKSKVQPGMEVAGSEGVPFGHVVQVHEPYFLIERPGADEYELYVPYDAIQSTSGDTITLNVPGNKVSQQPWGEFTEAGAGT